MPAAAPVYRPYANEVEGQLDFFAQFGIDSDSALRHNTDGIHRGTLLEFKRSISDLNSVLFQAVKYLSKLRVRGADVPAHILLVDLEKRVVYRFASADYDAEIHTVYNTAASRDNAGFQRRSEPETVEGYEGPSGARRVATWLQSDELYAIRITPDCVVAWAERYYRENPGATKSDFLRTTSANPGELRRPVHFARQIRPFTGDSYGAFAHILDRLNAKLQKIELGAFYTPDAYVEKATELLRQAIARVPAGNDYVVIDRCAGSGNLERYLTADELSHVIVNTFEEFEYLELVREFGDRVRAVIPPTYVSGAPNRGVLRNGDALSQAFITGEPGEVIREYVEDPTCTIILFENPPYGEVGAIEAQKKEGRKSFGWKASWARAQMSTALKNAGTSADGVKATNDLASVFIWSGFEYYLRQPTDSYVVFSPTKYFKSQNLVTGRRFMGGLLFNRRHFHTKVGAGISVVWWANEPEPDGLSREVYPLDVFDIDRRGRLVAGSANGAAPLRSEVATTAKLLSSLYAPLPDSLATLPGIFCEKNGREAHRATRGRSVQAAEVIGYLVAQSFSFENADLMTQLTRCTPYNGNGFYLTKDNFMSCLPLFVVGRYPAARRWWERGVVNRCADNGDNFSHDADFLKACLIYTSLARHNKCLSFRGSDGVQYQNELCFDQGTLASEEIARHHLTPAEQRLMNQWQTVLKGAKKAKNYNPQLAYGLYQIDVELNTYVERPKARGRGNEKVYDYPALNGDLATLKRMVADYHESVIAPKLWEYGLLK